jgi:hypothetical protein
MRLVILALVLVSLDASARTHKKRKARAAPDAEQPAQAGDDALQKKYLECYQLPHETDSERDAARDCYNRFTQSLPKGSEYRDKVKHRLQELGH